VIVTLNGRAATLEPTATVADVVATLLQEPRGVAVSVDREVIPRSAWSATVLHDGALIEVLTAASGG